MGGGRLGRLLGAVAAAGALALAARAGPGRPPQVELRNVLGHGLDVRALDNALKLLVRLHPLRHRPLIKKREGEREEKEQDEEKEKERRRRRRRGRRRRRRRQKKETKLENMEQARVL